MVYLENILKASMKNLLLSLILFFIGTNIFAQSSVSCFPVELVSMKGSKIQNKITREFDKFGNLLAVSTFQYNSENPVVSSVKNEYNSKNQLVKTTNYFAGKLVSEVSHQIDELGNQLSFSSIDNNGKTIQTSNIINGEKTINNFDEKGAISSVEKIKFYNNKKSIVSKYNAKNILISEEKYVYNPEGLLITNENNDILAGVKMTSKTIYNSIKSPEIIEEFVNDKFVTSVKILYNSAGKILKRTKLDSKNNEEYRIEYQYADGKEIEEISFYRNELVGKKTKTYDEKNNVIKETQTDKIGQIILETFYKYSCQ